MAGRGFGKSRTGAEAIVEWQRQGIGSMLLVGRTSGELIDTMVEGPPDAGVVGVMRCAPPWNRPKFNPQKKRLTWANGAVAYLRSADVPDSVVGLNIQKAWFDEVSTWQYPATFNQANLTLRIRPRPQAVITFTPRPNDLTRLLLSKVGHDAVLTRGRTFDNTALDDDTKRSYTDTYGGTRIGRQELEGELVEDVEGALWTTAMIDALRVRTPPEFRRIVVAIDPAATSNAKSDETGIVAVGVDKRGHRFVLADRSGRYSPDQWARAAIELHDELEADCLVAEKNNGGEMVETVIRQTAVAMKRHNLRVKLVWASRGKVARAEPTVAGYERGEVHHVGSLPQLEAQMCNMTANGFVGSGSPDRVDALVWADAELSTGVERRIEAYKNLGKMTA